MSSGTSVGVGEIIKRPLTAGELQRNSEHAHFLAMEFDPDLMPPVEVRSRARLDVAHATFNSRGEVQAVRRRRRHR